MTKFRTHYENLKVARNAPSSVIRAAYKTLMQQYHPDKYDGSEEESVRISKIIKDSYDVLMDPIRRAEHDKWIEEQEAKNFRAEYDFAGEDRSDQVNNSFDFTKWYREEDLYAMAAKELSSGNIKKGVMAKIFVETQGDMSKANAKYIQFRVNEFIYELLNYYAIELAPYGCKITTGTIRILGQNRWKVINIRNEVLDINNIEDFKQIIPACKQVFDYELRRKEEDKFRAQEEERKNSEKELRRIKAEQPPFRNYINKLKNHGYEVKYYEFSQSPGWRVSKNDETAEITSLNEFIALVEHFENRSKEEIRAKLLIRKLQKQGCKVSSKGWLSSKDKKWIIKTRRNEDISVNDLNNLGFILTQVRRTTSEYIFDSMCLGFIWILIGFLIFVVIMAIRDGIYFIEGVLH